MKADIDRETGELPPAGSPVQAPPAGLFNLIKNTIQTLEELPYGATYLQEKRVARVGFGLGLLLMAFGAAIFSVAWSRKWAYPLDIAFVVTLVGWMIIIISFAFWIVSSLAKRFPPKS